MPLDAITLRALTEELRPQLLNLRIDKGAAACSGSGHSAFCGAISGFC